MIINPHQLGFGARLLFLVICVGSIALYIISDVRNVGVDPELRTSWRLASVPVELFCMILMPLAFFIDGSFRTALKSRFFLFFGGYAAYGLLLALLFQNYYFFIRTDIVLVLWFVNGFALMRLLLVVRMEHVFFVIMIILLQLAIGYAIETELSMIRRDTERVGDNLIYRFQNMIIFPASFLVVWRMKWSWVTHWMGWGQVFSVLIVSVLLTATRSSIIETVLLTLLLVVALHGLPAPSRYTSGKVLIRIFAVCIVLAVLGFVFATVTGLYEGGRSYALQSRLMTDQSVYSRLYEAEAALASLNFFQLLFGGGFGHYFVVPWGDQRPTSSVHLAFLDPVLKVGILASVPFFILMYVIAPFKFLTAVFRQWKWDPVARLGWLIAYPPVGAIFVLMLMSGGFNQHSAIGFGMSFAILWSSRYDQVFRRRLAEAYK